ncbi:MAG: tetratricopeptide repeat protein [Candidatus Thermoplasmatota archaeon]|nr:tetratricopeptide repeat protein [Candidatus Thermoplasmatota archaeon]
MFPTHERVKTKYIGREEELSTLRSLLEEVQKGRGKLVLVEGEAGIGKTRMIEQMRALDLFSEFTFLIGRCLYFKDTDIYLPFKEMYSQYRQMIKGNEGGSPFVIQSDRQLVDRDLRTPSDQEFVPMSLIPAEIDLDDEGPGDEMVVEGLLEFNKLSQFIFDLEEKGPVCLFIDDLHWADPPSIKLLQFLAHKIVDHQVVIICTYRPEDLFWGEDASHPLVEPLNRLSRDKLYVPIELGRFDYDETEKFIRDILNVEKVPRSFSELVFKKTNGNPFFIEEVLYSLLERGIIDPTGQDWTQTIDPETISLPSTLRDVILRRIHWLKGNSMNVIRLASVSGSRITFDIIKRALEMKDEDIIEALEELVSAKFLVEIVEEENYQFENPVVQEVIYTELNHSRRRFLHYKMGKVLEERYSDNPTVWGNMAIHYYKGKDYEKALMYLTKASSYYQRISPQKALEYLHVVLECMERIPQSDSIKIQHVQVLLDISGLCLQIGDWNRSLEFSEKALNLATVLRMPLEIARAKLMNADVYKLRGDFHQATILFEEIASSPQDKGFSEVVAHAFMGLGYINWRTSDYPRALEMFSKSLQFAKIENNLNTIGTLYMNIGNVFNHRGDIKKALDYYNRGIKHLESSGNTLDASVGYSNIGSIYLQNGEFEEAEKVLELAISMTSERGRHDLCWPNINLIDLRGIQGKFTEASNIFEMCEDSMKDRDDKVGLGIAYLNIGKARILEQKPEEAETLIIRSITMLESLGMLYDLGKAKYSLGEAYLMSARYDEGKVYLDEAYQILKSIGARYQAEKVRGRLLEIRDSGGFI